MAEQIIHDGGAHRPHGSAMRGDERRADWEPMAENAMRCDACGTVWFSAVATLTVSWAACVRCGGPLHLERREAGDRRTGRFARS